jgi:hypothetical protein
VANCSRCKYLAAIYHRANCSRYRFKQFCHSFKSSNNKSKWDYFSVDNVKALKTIEYDSMIISRGGGMIIGPRGTLTTLGIYLSTPDELIFV